MLKTIVLLCSAAIADHAACTKRNAIDWVPLPTRGIVCGVGGEAMNAGAGEVLRAEPGKSYLKLDCERTRETAR